MRTESTKVCLRFGRLTELGDAARHDLHVSAVGVTCESQSYMTGLLYRYLQKSISDTE